MQESLWHLRILFWGDKYQNASEVSVRRYVKDVSEDVRPTIGLCQAGHIDRGN